MAINQTIYPGATASAGPAGSGGMNAEYVYMKASSARTAGDVVKVSSGAGGLTDAAATGSAIYQVAVAAENIASGSYGLYQVSGRCTITTASITPVAGNGAKVASGAVADTGSTAQLPNGTQTNTDFGVWMTAASNSTSNDVYLYGYPTTNT